MLGLLSRRRRQEAGGREVVRRKKSLALPSVNAIRRATCCPSALFRSRNTTEAAEDHTGT
jgi:hypothetical protein